MFYSSTSPLKAAIFFRTAGARKGKPLAPRSFSRQASSGRKAPRSGLAAEGFSSASWWQASASTRSSGRQVVTGAAG
jgi:hypothetical protein